MNIKIRKTLGAILSALGIISLAITVPVYAYGDGNLAEMLIIVFVEIAMIYFGFWLVRGARQ